jgi:hypothetical protein
MAIQLVNPVNYTFSMVGDGVSTSVSIDFYNQIQATQSLSNKNPVGIFAINAGASVTGTLSGTIVTLTFATAPANGTQISPNLSLLFDAV